MGPPTSNAMHRAVTLRMQGNELLKQSRIEDAIDFYSQALDIQPHDHAALSNRSHALKLSGRAHASAQDALKCVQVAPQWAKGYMRLAAACMDLHAWQDAAAVCAAGLQHAPGDKDILHLVALCNEAHTQQQMSQRCQRQILASSLATSMQHAQQAALEADLQHQLSNSMAAPGEWEPRDWEWRPTWLAEMRWPPAVPAQASASALSAGGATSKANTPLDATVGTDTDAPPTPACSSGTTVGGGDASTQNLLARLCHMSEEVAAPSELLAVLRDEARLHAYADAIRQALIGGQTQDVHVLCLGPGAPVWALLSAAAGAQYATVVCSTNLGYHAARTLLDANRHLLNWEAIQLAATPLCACSLAVPSDVPDEDSHTSKDIRHETCRLLGNAASIVVSDNFDHSILSNKGLVPDLEVAAARGLLAPGVRVLPQCVQLIGQLSQERHVGMVQGLDMSRVNSARWYPGLRPACLASTPHQALSAPALLATIHLTTLAQGLVAAHGAAASDHADVSPLPTQAQHVSLSACAGGVCNTLHTWPVLHFGAAVGTMVWDTRSGTITMSQHTASHAAHQAAPSNNVSHDNGDAADAAADSCSAGPGHCDDSDSKTAAGSAGACVVKPSVLWQSSLPQGALYLDPFHVSMGQQVELAVIVEPCAVHVTRLPASPSTPRDLLLPSWHVDMLTDDSRNNAYDQAFRHAVSHQASAIKDRDGVVVLDLGAGAGLVAMMAARCDDVTHVYAMEPRRAVASLLHAVLSCNPALATRTCVLPHSLSGLASRLLTAGRGNMSVTEDVTALQGQGADVVILQSLDSGLLGEGVLRCLTLGRSAGLISPTATIIPSAARVMFQLICLGPTVADLEPNALFGLPLYTSALTSFESGSDDYAALNLRPLASFSQGAVAAGMERTATDAWVSSPAGLWRPMSDAVLGMCFDFSQAHELHAQPEACDVDVTTTASGLVNAIAFWHELEMGTSALGGGPTQGTSTSQQVAVQRLGLKALHVHPGDRLSMHVAHDTYSLKFKVGRQDQAAAADDAGPAQQMHPLAQSCTAAAQALGAELNKACAQDPLTYRQVAVAALQLAARPQDYRGPGLGPAGRLPAAHAAQLAAQLCG